MSRPIIGMFAKIYKNDLTSEMFYQYHESIENAGGVPVLLPYVTKDETIQEFIDACDGFFITGGVDVDPIKYGEEMMQVCGEIEPERDELEFKAFSKILKSKKPLLGVCRGMQLINVALNGTLYQDIPTQIPSNINHSQPRQERFVPTHDVLVKEGTPLYQLVKTDRIMGNTFHHQAIKRLGNGLQVMAVAEDGIIEAIYSTDYPYLRGYQWHPERIFKLSKENEKIFIDFINACAK